MLTAPFPVKVVTPESKTVRVVVSTKNFDPPRSGPIRLPSVSEVGVSKVLTRLPDGNKAYQDNADLQVEGEFLNEGLNVLSVEEVARLKQQLWFETLEQIGVIRIMDKLPLPEGEISTNTTVDYAPKDAMEIIRSCDDIEWLRECNSKEISPDRQLVKKAIVNRISDLRKKEQQLEEARKG